MRLLSLVLIVALSFMTMSMTVFGPEKKLIADETWLTVLTKQVKIETSNETIKQKLEKRGGYTKFSAVEKKDRKGKYWHYSYYYPREGFKEPPL
jgi:hypothetical protein